MVEREWVVDPELAQQTNSNFEGLINNLLSAYPGQNLDLDRGAFPISNGAQQGVVTVFERVGLSQGVGYRSPELAHLCP